MKKIIFLLVCVFSLISCDVYTGIYDVGLINVEKPNNIKNQFSDTKVITIKTNDTIKYNYEDSLINIVWIPFSKQFDFKIINKTNNTIKIIWDDAVYISSDGLSQRVIHSGTKLIDKNSSQSPSIIVKGSYIYDTVIPVDNIYFSNNMYIGWVIKPLFNNSAETIDELNKFSNYYVGKSIKVLLPIKIENTINEYTFTFKINSFKVK